jgi:hypothetical protein
VTERGLTTITVAGTKVLGVGAGKIVGYRQPGSSPPSETGVQAGRLGLYCCESTGGLDVLTLGGMLMKWIQSSPAVETKKMELSGENAPASGAVASEAGEAVVEVLLLYLKVT